MTGDNGRAVVVLAGGAAVAPFGGGALRVKVDDANGKAREMSGKGKLNRRGGYPDAALLRQNRDNFHRLRHGGTSQDGRQS